MVIPDIQLRDLTVGSGKRLGVEPAQIVLEVIVIALGAQLLGERIVPALLGVLDVGPRSQRAAYSDAVVVNLVATPDHNMVRPLLVFPDDVVPEGSTTPSIFVGANTESIARVKHDAHGL